MRVYIASDHAGLEAKKIIKDILESFDCVFEDIGTFTKDSVDYPMYARAVCKNVLLNENSFGILICGSGTGMSIAANKVRGIRAAMCFDEYSAMMARYDNDANILCLRAREFDQSLYFNIIKAFLLTNFSNLERHIRRINALEK